MLKSTYRNQQNEKNYILSLKHVTRLDSITPTMQMLPEKCKFNKM